MTAPTRLDVPRFSVRQRLQLFVRVFRRAERRLLVVIAAALLLDTFGGVAQSVTLKWIIDGAARNDLDTATRAAIACGLLTGLIAVVGRVMGNVSDIVASDVGHLVRLESLELTATLPGIEHLERPDYYDQIALVRDGGEQLVRAGLSLTQTMSLLVRMGAACWLLAAIHPLLLAVPLFAVPSVLLAPVAQRQVDTARADAAEDARAATHLHQLFVTPASAIELRVFGAVDALDRRCVQRWRQHAKRTFAGSVRSALISSAGWVVLALGYAGALLFVANETLRGRATLGDVMLVSQLALQLRSNVIASAGIARSTTSALRTADRFLWLEDLADEQRARYAGTEPAPDVLRQGIEFDHVSFQYPGTTSTVLHDVTLRLRAGTTVAFVGANGAGKTTLVKLLAGLYQPSSGTITVDGTDLTAVDITDWRQRLAGSFQDYLRLETSARHCVGVGEPTLMDDLQAVHAAVERANAGTIIDRLPSGLDTLLGKTHTDGEQLSGGQWQRVAIARGMMRTAPLCLLLDEPTAALDPAAEHALYERYGSAAARTRDNGGITILVSHRFSSVPMADLIVVLSDGRVEESGSHDELLAANGTYAHMYRQQAAAYGYET